MRVALNNISHDFAGTVILTGVTQQITAGDRIGIVGANGSGKTTLINLITGALEPVSGTVSIDPGTRIGMVPQEMPADDHESLGDYLLADMLSTRTRLRELEERMAGVDPTDESALNRILDRYQQERESYDAAAGDQAEERAERLLAEAGLAATLDQPISTLSGGERNVVTLIRAVMGMPNLLVLDEPGNHLDFAGLEWLEQYLARFPGAVCVVSHNRYLLDKVATSIWEVAGSRVTAYTGDYSDYKFTRLTQALSDQASYKVQQQKLTRLEELVRVFEERARTTGDPAWGKRLRARRSQLDKARELAMDRPGLDNEKIDVVFTKSEAKSDIAVDVSSYSKTFGKSTLFTGAGMTVHVGERVGIVGPNGSGKTTFLNDLVRTGEWENPQMRIGPSMVVGYCTQHRNRFPPQTTLLDAMLSVGNFSRKEVFGVLSRLLFEWEDVDRTVGSLSGGEWNRLQIGIAIIARSTLLILDEPTNHLDIPSREAVEEALIEFNGTIIAVSHDRYFLDAVVGRIEEIDDQVFRGFDGSFSEFWSRRVRRQIGAVAGSSPAPRGRKSGSRQSGKTASLSTRGRAVSSRRKTHSGADVEREIERLEAEQQDLERRMTEAFEKSDYRGGRRLGEELRLVRTRIEELYETWEAS